MAQHCATTSPPDAARFLPCGEIASCRRRSARSHLLGQARKLLATRHDEKDCDYHPVLRLGSTEAPASFGRRRTRSALTSAVIAAANPNPQAVPISSTPASTQCRCHGRRKVFEHDNNGGLDACRCRRSDETLPERRRGRPHDSRMTRAPGRTGWPASA